MSLNILIVDDSAVMRGMIKRTLAICGIGLGKVSEAANGAEALEILEREWVDLALVDINMPVMNGMELIAAVREREEWRDMPIIVISTEGCETRIEALRKSGIGFVHKPFTPEKIRETIQGHVEVMELATGNGEEARCDGDFDF